ncbi:MAG: hypothetical protein Q8P31_01580 [Bacillota bacterium]|nr:hypothetical protein [Bacillota bacterium]
MDIAELKRRLSLLELEHERPGVVTLRHKDSGAALARCTGGTLIELMIDVLDAPQENREHNHWLWRHLENAAPLAGGGDVFEALRRQAQGLDGDTVQQTASAYLEQSERSIERRKGRQA